MKTILTTGCFDVLHVGHMRLLQYARSLGNILIVSINSDESIRKLKGDGRPINNLKDRLEMLMHCKHVSEVDVFEGDCAAAAIEKWRPDIFLKGGDYTWNDLSEAERTALRFTGAQFVTMPRIEGYSTTGILGRKS